MTYNQLLLKTGGGIMSNKQKNKAAKVANICIGLGGTGISCLKTLKREVYSQVEPDDPDARIPSFSHIQFLAVDTDKNSLESDGTVGSLNEATEFFDISCPNISALLEQTKVLAGNPDMAWLKAKNPQTGEEGLKILSAKAGAGAVRQIGRLLLIQKASQFVQRVAQCVRTARTGLPDGTAVYIHIFTGMGGGTGSGTFLDACYLVQKALEDEGIGGAVMVSGYFFLPDVNLAIPEVAADSSTTKFIKDNGFAAMKELDYCMDESNDGEWSQMYTGFEIRTQKPPVDLAYLVSAQTANGMIQSNGYEYAMNVVADFVMQCVVETSGFDLDSHAANFKRKVEGISKTAGANYYYMALGAANATVPYREITTYLASRLFHSMADIADQLPTNEQIEAAQLEVGLTFKDLRAEMMAKTTFNAQLLQLDYKSVPGLNEQDMGTDDLILPELLTNPYRNAEKKMKNAIAANRTTMEKPWSVDTLGADGYSDSVACRVYELLKNMILDDAKGPFYAAETLNGKNRHSFVSLLSGVKKEVQTARTHCYNDVSLRVQSVKATRHAFLTKKLGKKDNFESFCAALKNYFTNEFQIAVYNEMESMIGKLIENLTELYDRHFFVYVQVTQNLIDTFKENEQYLALEDAEADPFVEPLMTIKALKPALDKAVEAMNLPDEKREFQQSLFPEHDVWKGGDEQKISQAVAAYFLKTFDSYTNRTISDYLEMRFNTNNPQVLADKTYREVMMPLNNKATPLFWLQPGYQQISEAPIGYCTIPEVAVLQTAANTMALSNQEISVIPSGISDRISILRCYCGTPLYAYNGINTYIGEYIGSKNVGRHLYERTKRDLRDWRNLNNLQPFSTLNNPSEKLQQAAAAYDEGVTLGTVAKLDDTEEYKIYILDDITPITAQAEAALDDGGLDKMQEVLLAVKSVKTVSMKNLPNDGAMGHEEKVRKDHAIASSGLTATIVEENKKRNTLNVLVERLEAAITQKQKHASMVPDFYDAVYTGIISLQIPKVIWNRGNAAFGLVDEQELSNPTMQPYGGISPLYQAFVSFNVLSDGDRNELMDAVDGMRMNPDIEKLRESTTALKAMLTPQYINAQVNFAKRKVPEQADAIKKFLTDLFAGIDDFKMMYGIM